MKNKYVGLLVMGVALIFFLLVQSFNHALETIVDTSCTHGNVCPMFVTLKTQKIISYGLIGLLTMIGFFILFLMKEEEKRPYSTGPAGPPISGPLSEEEKQKRREGLDEEEKRLMDLLFLSQGSVYQSDLIKETGWSKVRITRLLDRLEGRGLIERRRRGMTNIVLLK